MTLDCCSSRIHAGLLLAAALTPLCLADEATALVPQTPPRPQAAAASASRDHPLVTPYQGSTLTRRDDSGFTQYRAVLGLDPQGKTDDAMIKTEVAPGDLTSLAYENPRGRSPSEILANYRDALQKAGFKIVFQCAVAECGGGGASARWARVTGIRYVASDMHFLSARRDGDEGPVLVSISVLKARHAIDVLVGKAMETGLVTITGAALKGGLMGAGRVVLDGIFFDHDKATMTSQSKAALEVIAAFLTENPSLAVFIVGHTDSAGVLDYNLTLSRQRAQAVVDRLAQEYKIAPGRLSAHGVGPLAPSKTNATDAGKAKNRRVEMVAR